MSTSSGISYRHIMGGYHKEYGYSIRTGCSLHDSYIWPRSLLVLISLNVSCPLNDYSIGEYPLQIFSSYNHNCFSSSPRTVLVTPELPSLLLRYSSFHHY